MTPKLNIQIIPAPDSTPTWGKIVQLPARGGQGEEQLCHNCKGTGHFGRHSEICRKCGGTGKALFVRAARLSIETAEQRAEVFALLETCKGPNNGRTFQVQANVELHETGGGLTNTGHATIIANVDGTTPVSLWGKAYCDGPHAVFYMHAALVVEYSQHRGHGGGIVYLVGVDRCSEDGLGVERVPLWKFIDGEEAIEVLTPERVKAFEFPSEAVKAARRKAQCYHCRSAFYAINGASGPSGALTGAGAAYGGEPSPFKGPGKGY